MWKLAENRLGLSPIAQVDDTEKVKAGTIARAEDGDLNAGEFIYLEGAASTEAGDVVTYDQTDFTTARLQGNATGQVAIAMAAVVAGKFGWYQIGGKAIANVAASFADDADVYATATAGTVDDAVVAGDRIKGMRSASAIGTPAAGQAYVAIDRPYVDDIAD